MKLCIQDKHLFWKFNLLAPFKNVIQASFQKHGDLSHESVQNLLRLKNLAWAKQVHGSDILEVSAHGFAGEGDILTTQVKNIALSIQHADCQAALFYDPVTHTAAAAHCGWRGSNQKVYTKTIAFLKKRYGCAPSNIIVCISPSLGPSAAQFVNYKQELSSFIWPYQFMPFHFDFWQMSYDELTCNGIKNENIEIAKICTCSNPNDYYSYRFDRTAKRLTTLIALQ